jgi:ribosomal protein L19
MIFLASAEKLYAQEKTTDCGAGILTVLKGDMLTITALYKNNDQEPVYYYHELVVKRSGGSNISSNTQTGRISVQPGIEKSLAESTINILPGDTIDLELKIIDNNKVICTTKHQFVAPKSDIQKP